MKIGVGLFIFRLRGALLGGVAPSAFTAGQWSITDAATGGDATVNISALPSNGGSALTALQYKIGGGSWLDFAGVGTGSRTISGFTDLVSTNVNIRAVNAIGPSPDSDTKSITTTAGATAPAAMTVGQWGWATAGAGQITVNLLVAPSNGGSAITDYQYKIGAGAWTSFGTSALGSYTISGFTDGVATNLLVRAINAIGNGADSDTKVVTSEHPLVVVSTLPDAAQAYPTAMTAIDFSVSLGNAPYSLVTDYDQVITGITLNPTTGVLSGTPTDRRGRGWHEIRVRDAAGDVAKVRMCSAPDINPANFTHVYNGVNITTNTTLATLTGDVLIINCNIDKMLTLRSLTGGIVVVANCDVDSVGEDGLRLSNTGNVENCTVWQGNWVTGKNAFIAAAGAGVTHPGLRLLNMRIVDTGVVGGGSNFHGIYCEAQDALVEGCSIGVDTDFPSAPGMQNGSGISMRSAGIVRGNRVRTCLNDGIGYYASAPSGGGTLLVEQNNIDAIDLGASGREAINLLGIAGDAPIGNFISAATIRHNVIGSDAVLVHPDYAANSIPVTQYDNTSGIPIVVGAPAPFAVGDWEVTRGGPNQAVVKILTLPANFGRPLEGIQYRLDGGSWQDLAGAYAIGVGSYIVPSVTDGVAFTIELRSHSWNVFSAVGDVKNIAAPGVAVTVPAQVAPWGAKTLSGGGLFRPLNSLGQPVDLAAAPAPSLQSGSAGAYTATIATTGTPSVTGLGFTGAAGAPAGSVWRCALAAGGTVDITIGSLEANTYHVQTIQQASTAYGSAVLGDKIRFRAGEKNLAMGLVAINRGTAPSGTWTGGSDLALGNWVVLTRDVGHPVTIGAIYVNGNAAKYLRMDDLDFLAPFTGNGGGGNASISSTIDWDGGVFSSSYYAVTNCRSRHTRAVVGTDLGNGTSPYTFIRSVYGGPCWFEGNVIAGGIYGIQFNNNGATTGTKVRRNILRRCQEDAIQIGACEGGIFEGNLITDKIWQHRALAVTAITPGNPTVLTVADTTGVLTGGSEFLVLTGFTGDWAQHNGKSPLVASKTGTTITITFNSTGLVWDGLGGIARCPTLAHGDFWQFQDSVDQNNIQFRGNVNTRGYCDGHFMPDGQGLFANGASARNNWTIEGNIFEITLVRALSISNLNNSMVRSNTGMRPLGLAGGGASNVSLIQDGGGTGNTYRDNLFPSYSLGSTAIENTNSVVVSLISTASVPANATDVSTAESHFDNPATVPDETYDGRTAYATKLVGGAQAGPIFAGATPYFDFDTLVYSNPRP